MSQLKNFVSAYKGHPLLQSVSDRRKALGEAGLQEFSPHLEFAGTTFSFLIATHSYLSAHSDGYEALERLGKTHSSHYFYSPLSFYEPVVNLSRATPIR